MSQLTGDHKKTEILKLSTFNCRGLREGSKRRTVFQWLRRFHNGIILLQETHSTEEVENNWKVEWKGHIEFSHGKSTARGVAILFSPKLDIQIINVIKDTHGRFLLLQIKLNDKTFVLVNVYAPTKDKKQMQIEFLDYVQSKVVDHVDKSILIGGDFNICLDPNIDKIGGTKENVSESAQLLLSIIEELNLMDIWRILNTDAKLFTRREMSRNGLVQSRLDFWLTSNDILYDLQSQAIKPGLKSDHSIVNILLSLKDTQRCGRGFYKFNSSLLKDTQYVDLIKKAIQQFRSMYSNVNNKGLLWDALKCEIRGITISFASHKAKEKRKLEAALQKKLELLEQNLEDNNFAEYKEIKLSLENMAKEHATGIQLRSKARLIEESEQNLKYFSKLECQNFNTKHIRSLIKDGKTITDPNEILREEESFYKTLYTEPHNNNVENSFFNDEIIPQLSPESRNKCDLILTEGDLAKALRDLPNNKTPGSDGISTEFYKFFWPDVKDIVTDSIHYALDNKQLSIDQKRGILTLIPKKDKDLRHLKNWRPLSLLNTDYKILTKALASRLQDVIPEIVSPNQTGYIKGRYIGENIRTIYDIIEYTSLKNIPGMIVMLDFEKPLIVSHGNFFLKHLTLSILAPTLKNGLKSYTRIHSAV